MSIDQTSNTPTLDAIMREIDRKPSRQNKPLDEADIQTAQLQGRDMVEHFTNFITGGEINFSRYFQTENEYHAHMHRGFWDEIRTNYPDMVTLSFPDYPGERQHVFGDLGVALREKVFIHESGAEYAVEYHAERIAELPVKIVGNVALAHLSQ